LDNHFNIYSKTQAETPNLIMQCCKCLTTVKNHMNTTTQSQKPLQLQMGLTKKYLKIFNKIYTN